MFYAQSLEFLGYKPDQDEWKVMALSALENKDKTFLKNEFLMIYVLMVK